MLACALAGGAHAQGYPAKPLRLICPYPPGGGLDILTRPVAQKLAQQLGQPVIVENKPGASGVIGGDAAAKAPPDGYTFMVAFGSHYLQPFVSKSVPYDVRADFVPIASVAKAPIVVVAHPALPVTSMRSLVELAKAKPGQLGYVTAGNGTQQHLAGIALNQAAGIDMLHVSYKGGSPALNDLLGGQVQVGILVMSTVWPHVQAGKLRPLGVIESTRAKSAPEVPTVAEGGVAGYAMPDMWIGFLGPKGFPAAAVARLAQEIGEAARSAEVRPKLESIGYEIDVTTPAEFARKIETSLTIYEKLAAGVKP